MLQREGETGPHMLMSKDARSPLTPRERDVVRGVLAAKTNREIADELGVSVQAVKNVLSTVYVKCHVRNRLELAVRAMRDDLLSE